jgi:hypothetical protein
MFSDSPLVYYTLGKMRIIICIVIFANSSIAQNFVQIPDVTFAAHLATTVPAAMSGQSLNVTHSLVTQSTKILSLNQLPISNLYGLQFFTSLTKLDIQYCFNIIQIPPLPVSLKELSIAGGKAPPIVQLPTGLQTIYLNSCSLTGLPVLNKALTGFWCSNNSIVFTTLPDSLKDLACINCSLNSLPDLPSSLLRLKCDGNHLTNLPNLPLGLQYLHCSGNFSLTSLPKLPPRLKILDYNSTSIRNVNFFPDSLSDINCSFTGTDSLYQLPASLVYLTVDRNKLKYLPQLPQSLQYLNCASNELRGLPVLPRSLISLDCQVNEITSLPHCYENLRYLYCGYNKISCLTELPCCTKLRDCNSCWYMKLLPNPLTCIPSHHPLMQYELLALPICTTDEIQKCALLTDIKNKSLDDVSVFPNPANELITIETSIEGKYKATIYNMSGTIVYSEQLESKQISISHLPPALYTLILNIKDQYLVRRFTIIK